MSKPAASKVLNKFWNKKLPVDIYDILKKLDIKVEFSKELNIIGKIDKDIFIVKEDISTYHKKFTLSCLLYLYLLNSNVKIIKSIDEFIPVSEMTDFVYELLIPKNNLLEIFYKTTKTLEEVFEMSKFAITKQYKSYVLESSKYKNTYVK